MIFTANRAREMLGGDDLDERIENAVNSRREGNGAYLRIYTETDRHLDIEYELEKRGFTNIQHNRNYVLTDDVYFEW